MSDGLKSLAPKTKQPNSAKTLNVWIAQAESKLGPGSGGGRLGWFIASSVAIAAVQRAVDADGRHLFLLKGGTLLQHRLNLGSRATQDIDGLVRGDIEDFLDALDDALAEPWGPVMLRHGPIDVIDVPTKVIKPRRFDIFLELRGHTWRRIPFEIAADEAGIGEEDEFVPPPTLAGFGLPDPDKLVGIAMRFQIAQKLHAVTDPHDPPSSFNERVRDVVDLVLLQDLVAAAGSPTDQEIAEAARAVFLGRAEEAVELGRDPRSWPPVVATYPHWEADYRRAAASAQLDMTLDEAVGRVNQWISDLATY